MKSKNFFYKIIIIIIINNPLPKTLTHDDLENKVERFYLHTSVMLVNFKSLQGTLHPF